MKLRRLLISVVAVLLISLAAVIAVSADEGQFEVAVGVSSSTAISKDGELCLSADNEIELTVSINSNPGISSFQINIAYNPDVVTPVLDNAGNVIVDNRLMSGLNVSKQSDGVITFNRMDATSATTTETGTATIRFKVKPDVCSEVKFTVTEAFATYKIQGSIIPGNYITKNQVQAMNASLAENTFAAHDYALTGTTAPTCEADGIRHFACESCSAKLDKKGDAPVGHTPVREEDKQTSCTEPGYLGATTCSVCSKVLYERVEIPAIPHNAVEVKGHDATCTEDGKTDGKQCSACQTWVEEQKVIPSHHSQLDKGEKCSVCGKKASGCGSAIGTGAIAIIAISLVCAPIFKKKKH